MGDESVLERILNGNEDPKDLPLALLQRITNDFSEERKIGQGGFGAVYKGVLQNGITVAVKRIYINLERIDDDDKLFEREFNSLWKTNHQNVARCLGFCSNTSKTPIRKAGSKEIYLANVRERLFCLEYVSNGSLDKHITDELRGFEWKLRFEIIMGICKGLCYLHEEKQIVHMDLKPANILLDGHMVPKITDFGLSRPNENSHTMGQRFGTRGYLAPEYENAGRTSFECDIYILGAIIIELVTGCMGVPDEKNVLRRWRHRWNRPPTPLQYQQVTRCIEIAARCRKQEPKDRPSIGHIISFLRKSKSMDGHTGQESPYLDNGMLGIEPLALHFTFMLNKEMSCSVKLTNKTKACFAFNIERPNKEYTIWPEKGIVPPECNEYLVQMTVHPQERAPQVTQNTDKFIVKSTKVSEDLRVEDITEHIFHEGAGKVVDNVDLMVIYEPTKPQENCKSREDTNMPAEEVPKAKKRKVLGSSYCDIDSSMQGQCTKHTEQFKFYPPLSFSRHYPINTTYLGKGSRSVDVTRGAMGSLLDKLGKLVREDYNLETSVKRDIESFSENLAKFHKDLLNLRKLDGVEIWVDEVRELSYNIEDMVDSFAVRVELDSTNGGFKELPHEGLTFLENDMTTGRQIGDVIRDIKNQVQAMADRQKKYNFSVDNVIDDSTVKAPIDPRMPVSINKKQLVGIEGRTDEFIRLFEEDGDVSTQELKIVSIVGLGGLGKTTLARAVYDKLKAQYHSTAFVSVGQNPDMKKVLMNILSALGKKIDDMEVWQLTDEIQKLLENKRYLIVIDDIWDSEAWGPIQSGFPENSLGSRVITTTRIHHVALASCNAESKFVYAMKSLSVEDSRRLFLRRIYGAEDACPDTPRKEEISVDILKKCCGMPLAIISIASLLAGEPASTWDYVRKIMGAMTEGDDVKNMKKILDLSYIHLPDHLKTCLLHVCMYSEDHEIDKNDLTRQWVAEGFVVSTNGLLDAQDVAEKYFKQLISMCMIQPERIEDHSNEVLSCTVHDIILDLMRTKSSEENFSHVTDGSETCAHGEIRRISVHCNDKEDSAIFERIKGSLSHARSALFYRVSPIPYLVEFKYVRVLHIESIGDHREVLDLSGITRLFLLRYLKIDLSSFQELKLPDQIRELHHLETMDLKHCRAKKYPSDIVCLPWLSHISNGFEHGIALPDGVERLKSLRTLEGVHLYKSSAENIKGLAKLANLRRLWILLDEAEQATSAAMCMDALHSSISKISSSLRILTLGAEYCRNPWFNPTDIVDVPPGWSSMTLFPDGSAIRELDLCGCRFEKCPGWISQLSNLHKLTVMVREVADGLNLVSGLSSLAFFRLAILGVEPQFQKEESVVIPGGGAFKALKELTFHCPKAALTFEPGAMPKLEKLVMTFRYEMTPQLLLMVGIHHLPAPTLKEIWLCVEEGSMKVKGSEDWGEYKWERYFCSDRYWGEYRDKQTKHDRKLKAMLQKAFKHHHPRADIYVSFEGYFPEYLEEYSYEEYYEEDDNKEEDDEEFYFTEEDDESVDDEEYYSTEDDDRTAYQLNGSEISAQLQANTRQLVQLIEEQQDSGGINITTDTAPAPVVDTSLRLAVKEGWQSGQGEGFSENDDKREDCYNEEDDEAAHQVNEPQTSEEVRADTRQSLQPSSTSQLALCLPSSLDLTLALAAPTLR